MKLLLDTHIWVWSLLAPENLTGSIEDLKRGTSPAACSPLVEDLAVLYSSR